MVPVAVSFYPFRTLSLLLSWKQRGGAGTIQEAGVAAACSLPDTDAAAVVLVRGTAVRIDGSTRIRTLLRRRYLRAVRPARAHRTGRARSPLRASALFHRGRAVRSFRARRVRRGARVGAVGAWCARGAVVDARGAGLRAEGAGGTRRFRAEGPCVSSMSAVEGSAPNRVGLPCRRCSALTHREVNRCAVYSVLAASIAIPRLDFCHFGDFTQVNK